MDRSEAKFKNTAIKMQEALLDLLNTKSFEEITVTDVTQKAKVNRSTFYSHYQNTFDLLSEIWEESRLSFEQKTKNIVGEIDFKRSDLTLDDINFITPKFLLPYLQFVKENKKLFNVFVSNIKYYNSTYIFDYFQSHVLKPVFERYNIFDETLIFYLSKYYTTGISTIIVEWVKRDCIDDMMLICEIIMLAVRPTNY
ncbi:MAG: TetR/AcrR family transcriptional regulator C-terminal domain-containing protein [Clostridia bacterium]|nr:TetR/AcrR family transcriptional regulator C-terminal domain-containing protein [Clostridia bacterium]